MEHSTQRIADKIKRNLFLSKDELLDNFSENEYEKKKRIMLCVTKKMDEPIISDKELIKFLTTGCGGVCLEVPQSTAYRDLRIINSITGNIQLADKKWNKYMVIETAKEGIKKAMDKDLKAVASFLKVIVEAAGLNREDTENILDQMLPFDPLITDDPSVLGQDIELIKDADKRRYELRKLFNKQKSEVVDYKEQDEETT